MVHGSANSMCRSTSGAQAASVFPVAVADTSRASCPSRTIGMAARWTGVSRPNASKNAGQARGSSLAILRSSCTSPLRVIYPRPVERVKRSHVGLDERSNEPAIWSAPLEVVFYALDD